MAILCLFQYQLSEYQSA